MPETPAYPNVDPSPSFPAIEEAVLAEWDAENTFQRSIDARSSDKEFVFYDGPPFANGLPHYGHMITGFVKDVVPRYKTMRGYRVERRFGWDCHGLPAEMAAEKELGISGHVEITKYGIENFNNYCRESVQRYTSEWEQYVRRIARWVDFKNDYKTMDSPYMESVMWAFKTLWDKGLIYEGFRVLPYCWECETPLSNFETRLDDAYRERKDQSATVMFKLKDDIDGKPTYLLAWTTTPWTLPSNLAIAVGADIDYAVLEEDGKHYVLADAARERYSKELDQAAFVKTIKGSELETKQYEPLFPFFKDNPDSFQIFTAEYVTTEDGTGAVHLAAYGEDDFNIFQEKGIPIVAPVDQSGKFDSTVPPYAGMQVFDANKQIIKDLKEQGKLVRQEQYIHSYPHCWRTDTPLIYKPVSSWFVEVTKVKERALELNEEITWYPEHVKHGAFGKWLENARDWSISRNRFWGSPIPVWKSDDPAYPRVDVYGSLDEIERDFGVRPDNLHRPHIDNLTRPNPDDPSGKSTMRRVEEVLDCWFESGSMPYAQVHYPFEAKDWFDSHNPADFIVEYIAQTRAWFYNLHVLGTALFDRPPFINCVVHGNILGSDGRKMSKRLKNYPDPQDVFNNQGADALRWALISSAVLRGGDMIVDEKVIVDSIRQVINPLWNAYYFFTLYANSDGIEATDRTDATGVLDKYILAKTHRLVADVTTLMDEYDIPGACAAIATFIDALNNWYIRRSRDRFWKSEHDQDKKDAYDTLYTVLKTLCQVASPVMPMITESIYRGLGAADSVHLTDWPEASAIPADDALVDAMDEVREVCSAGLSIRKAQNLRVRLPLQTLTLASADADKVKPYIDLITDEVNVKTVELSQDVSAVADEVLQLNLPVLAPRIGQDIQRVIKAAREGNWKQDGDNVSVDGVVVNQGEYEMRVTPKDSAASRILDNRTGVVSLDIKPTPELEAEGLARDVVRLVQVARREAGLHISDHIQLSLSLPQDAMAAVNAHRDYVCEQTLANDLQLGDDVPVTSKADLNGTEIGIGVVKA